MTAVIRCDWALQTEIEQDYHDTIWGKPVHDDHQLFKMLMLEGQQAGLSWVTILRKWDDLCSAYDDFQPEIMATYTDAKRAELLENKGIIRNRLKVAGATINAQAYLKMRDEGLTFDHYFWAFVDGEPIVNQFRTIDDVPATTELAEQISKDLKRRGFTFVGPTIVYAFMQSIGMVNDHLVDCAFR